MFNTHAFIEVELQTVPSKGGLFYLTKQHETELNKKMLQYCNEFQEYYDELNDEMYLGDVIYVYEVALLSDGDVWISLSTYNPCTN